MHSYSSQHQVTFLGVYRRGMSTTVLFFQFVSEPELISILQRDTSSVIGNMLETWRQL